MLTSINGRIHLGYLISNRDFLSQFGRIGQSNNLEVYQDRLSSELWRPTTYTNNISYTFWVPGTWFLMGCGVNRLVASFRRCSGLERLSSVCSSTWSRTRQVVLNGWELSCSDSPLPSAVGHRIFGRCRRWSGQRSKYIFQLSRGKLDRKFSTMCGWRVFPLLPPTTVCVIWVRQ